MVHGSGGSGGEIPTANAQLARWTLVKPFLASLLCTGTSLCSQQRHTGIACRRATSPSRTQRYVAVAVVVVVVARGGEWCFLDGA